MSLCNTRRSIGLYVTVVLALVNVPVSGFVTGRIEGSALETTTAASNTQSEKTHLLEENSTGFQNEHKTLQRNDTNTSKLTTEYDRVESTIQSTIADVIDGNDETVNTASKNETNTVVMKTDEVINESTANTLSVHITTTTPTLKENNIKETNKTINFTAKIIDSITSEDISTTETNEKGVVTDTANTNFITEMTNNVSYSAVPVNDTPDTTTGKVAIVINVTDVTISETTTTNLPIPILSSTRDEITGQSVTNIDNITSTPELTENMVVEPNSHPFSPTWKKYTTIQRSKTSTAKEALVTTTEIIAGNLVNLENSDNSSIALPKLTTERNEESTLATQESNKVLLNVTNTEHNFTMPTILEDATEVASGIVKSMSKIGGFLDLSTKADKSIINTNQKPVEKKANSVRHSEAQYHHLGQDEITEELLREETLRDEKYREERLNIKNVQPSSNGTQDELSVKPVGDKINSSIYLVNPNYKPLKKIDVQPPKPFVRDPDDNSWRNESISSLGIVFKPKNSTKQFTQVLKNKTETELNGTLEKDNRNDVPELRQRLEKIAEIRKSKKKKINGSSEIVYTDYGENFNSGERDKTLYIYPTSIIPLPVITNLPVDTTRANVKEHIDGHTKNDHVATRKPKKYFNILDYYESNDEDEKDYVTMTEIDLKRFTVPVTTTESTTTTTPQTEIYVKPTTSLWQYRNEKRPTLQYFPPLKPQKVSVNEYETEFNKKMNMFTLKDDHKEYQTQSTPLMDDYQQERVEAPRPQVLPPVPLPRLNDVSKNLYFTRQPQLIKPSEGFSEISQNENYNRDAYILKNLKDFMGEAVFSPSTEAPMRGVTVADFAKERNKAKGIDDDYDLQFRKDVLNRFVDNFNQNSERFKVDFPILFNNSVVHKLSEPGKVLAMSNAVLKRLYDVATPKYPPFDPNCDNGDNGDNVTVELSPAYELHYYVPEQEEKEQVPPKPPTGSYGYRYSLE